MPKPMYFYPFEDKTIDSGFVGNISAKTALHCIAPTFGRKHFVYLWKIKKQKETDTFEDYIGTSDRIYVLGHCEPVLMSCPPESWAPGARAQPRNWPNTSWITG